MKVAITGATGGLGRSLCEFLIEQHCEVVALGRNALAGQSLQKLGANFVPCEITAMETMKNAFEGCDAVVHCAGIAAPWGKWEQFHYTNVKGTQAVLDAIRRAQVPKLIHLSTPSIYFNGTPAEMVTEDRALPEPSTNYAKSKIMADQLVLRHVEEYGTSAILLRPRAVFGKYDATILPRVLRMMKKGFFLLPDHGEAMIDITAVENVTHAIWLCLQLRERFDQTEAFNITNDEPMTVHTLISLFSSALQMRVRMIPIPANILMKIASASETFAEKLSLHEPLLTRYAIQSISVSQTLSIDKAKMMLGYRPIISTRESIEKIQIKI